MKEKHVLHLFIYILLGWMAACSHPSDETVETKLTQAEAIMYAAPDSALQLLENLQPPKGKEQRATWALLLAQARYKSNVRQSDSLVNTAYNYFKNTDDAERKALALYLKGGIAGENGDANKEQELYLKAQDEVQKTHDYRLGFLITSNLCNLYAYKDLKEYALEALEKAYQYAQDFGDPEYILSSYIFFARIHTMEPIETEKAIHYYQEGIKLAKENRNWNKLELMVWEYTGFLCFSNNYKQALIEVQQYMKMHETSSMNPKQSLVLGNIYRGLGEFDSAHYYLNKAIHESQNLLTKKGAYNYLYNLERERGRYKEALAACEKCLAYTDSLDRKEKAQEFIEMQAKYDQQKIIIERNMLQIEKERLTRRILILIVVTIFIIALVIGCYQRILIINERKLKKQEECARQNALKLAENEIQMSRNKQRISELTQQINANQGLKEQLCEQMDAIEQMKNENIRLLTENKQLQENTNLNSQILENLSKDLEELNKLTAQNKLLHERENTLTGLLVKRSPLLSKIKAQHPYIKDDKWEEIEEELNLIFNNYAHKLQEQVSNISESELHLAYLIKLKMSNKEMSDALGISPSSVAKSKMRLKDRLSHNLLTFDKTMMLDMWLWDF